MTSNIMTNLQNLQLVGKRNLPLIMVAFAGAQGAGSGKKADTKPADKATEPVPTPEPTSAKLTEIRAKQAEVFATLQGLKFGTPEQKDASLQLFKLENEEKAEIANIKKAENDAKLQAARNERLKLIDDYDSATGDAKVAAREKLANELLARYATSSPAKRAAGGNGGGGNKTTEIFALMDGGSTYDDLIAAGYADGTIRSAAWKGGYKKGEGGKYVKSAPAVG
jgi:hypothetical protein